MMRLVISFAIFSSILYANGVIINEEFYLCDKPHDFETDRIIDLEQSCMRTRPVSQKWLMNDTEYHGDTQVLARSEYPVSGIALECQMIEISVETYRGLFGGHNVMREEKTIELSEQDCRNMIYSKKCNGKEMVCDGLDGKCSYKEEPTVEFAWLQYTNAQSYHCNYQPRKIKARSGESPLFRKGCKVKDLFCKLEESMIVWSRDVIPVCELEHVAVVSDLQIRDGYLALTNRFNIRQSFEMVREVI